jgi:uncharacterized protein (TIGR01244 family)
MRTIFSLAAVLLVTGLLASAPAGAQVIKEAMPGVTNYARVESTVACAGAITTEAIPELKKLGYRSIINLRLATEPGANIEEEAAAAKAAGVNFAHLPCSAAKPDPAVADQFLKVITGNGMQPAFIHCAGGGRAAAMWFIKRVEVDGWDVEKASEEATALGLTNATLKQFALAHIEAHRK